MREFNDFQDDLAPENDFSGAAAPFELFLNVYSTAIGFVHSDPTGRSAKKRPAEGRDKGTKANTASKALS